MTISIDKQVSDGMRDTHQLRLGGGYAYHDDNITIYCCFTQQSRRDGGVIFTGIDIPQGKIITAAKLTVEVANDLNDDIYADIYGEAVDSAADFAVAEGAGDLITRTKTTAKVNWDAAGIGTGWKDSPDFKDVIQEVVNRPLWVPGNNLCIILYALAAYPIRTFTFYTYEAASPHEAAKLHIEYEEAAVGRSYGYIIG